MSEVSRIVEVPKFSSTEEEIQYLRAKVLEQEDKYLEHFKSVDRESVIREEIRKYARSNPDEVLTKGHKMLEHERREIVLALSPEAHDRKMEELLSILSEKGLKNVLDIVRLMGNPHLEDDFHRFMVQYVKAGLPISDIKGSARYKKSLSHTLYEVSLPVSSPDDKSREKALKELVSSMEQFYAGMLSTVVGRDDSFTIEIANSEGSEEAVFYVSIPDEMNHLFEKHVLSIFPKAKLFEKNDDFNIFNYDGATVALEGGLHGNPIFPLKTYDKFDFDPLNILLSTFGKIDRDGEGAAVQIVIRPDSEGYLDHYKEALRELERGESSSRALDVRHSLLGQFSKTLKIFTKEAFEEMLGSSRSKNASATPTNRSEENRSLVEQIKDKVASPIVHVNVRIVASAVNSTRSYRIAYDLASAFNQFENTLGTKLHFKDVVEREKPEFLRKFIYRIIDESHKIPLSIREVTSFMHFPWGDMSSPHLKVSRAASAPAPVGLPRDGVLLGVNRDRNQTTNIFITPEDRLRHMYVIGQTGTGKTTLLKNMIAQDIIRGEGVCFIDPHGSDIQDILSVIPRERYEDVIYFDPGYTKRPMALNMLEYDLAYPEQKTFVVNEMLSIFNKLFDMKVAGGPAFEQYFRNSVLLVMEDPESGNTLIDVSRVLSNKAYREYKLSRCKNPLVKQFWENATKTTGEQGLANYVQYVTNKFDVFLSNDIMRPIVSQEKSSFNFRDVMDNKKILLVNLSKGRLGDINANLIGLILVGKILMAALSRADAFGKDLPPFYLYIDEFQNVTTDSISQILSEARKYKLSLTIAHQFIAQLEDDIKDSVFGNVGTISSFRVGADDAEYLEKQFEPVFTASDLMNLDNRNAYMKLLADGKPVRPFSMETIVPMKGDMQIVEKLKELSYLTYGKDKDLVEEEIQLKYRANLPQQNPEALAANPFANV